MADNNLRTIRIEIDGNWTVEDMASFLVNLNDLYSFRYQLGHFQRELYKVTNAAYLVAAMYGSVKLNRLSVGDPTEGFDRGFDFEPSASLVKHPLLLTHVRYGSPGVTDVTGLAGIVGHIKDFLTRVIEWSLTKTQRDLENQARDLSNHKQQIENAILRGRAEQEIERLRLDNIVRLLNVYADNMVEVPEHDLTQEGMKHAISFLAKRQEVVIRLVEAGLIKSLVSVDPETNRLQL